MPRSDLRFDLSLYDRSDVASVEEFGPIQQALPKALHARFLRKALRQPLPTTRFGFATSRSWMVYHILHGLQLLEGET
ncbi:MAG: hypothetical protein KVP17_003660 [Porospora cf. gigantea B]|uniref:uncharacterized protein n=1 Tax=Porospora cf. gigantea B TaxID=2853592 RepID=UPI003571E97E|nr:MAG: hypothetical protein KVP17_003660 [Porospora cf. gigantea B]